MRMLYNFRMRCLDLLVFNKHYYKINSKKGKAATNKSLWRAFLRKRWLHWDDNKGYYIKYELNQSNLVIEARIYERAKYNKRSIFSDVDQ